MIHKIPLCEILELARKAKRPVTITFTDGTKVHYILSCYDGIKLHHGEICFIKLDDIIPTRTYLHNVEQIIEVAIQC